MKISDVTTFVIKKPPPTFGGQYFIVVKVTTDSGVVGYGEIYAATFGPHVIASMVDDVAARWVIDHDPHRIELMWRRIYSSGYALRPDPTLVAIMSGLEMACWDIVGKDAGKPVYDLLGGRVHDRIRTYTYLYPSAGYREVYTNPEHAAARAANEVERGFTALKFDPAGPYTAFDGHMPSLDDETASISMLAALREASEPVPTCCSARTGSHRRRGDSAREAPRTVRSAVVRRTVRPGPASRDGPSGVSTSRPASDSPRCPSSRRSAATRPHRSGNPTSAPLRRSARRKEDRCAGRSERMSDRPTSVLGPDPRRRQRATRSHASQPAHHRGHPGWGDSTGPAHHPDPLGGGVRDPVDRAGPGRRTRTRRWRSPTRGPTSRADHSTCRWFPIPSADARNPSVSSRCYVLRWGDAHDDDGDGSVGGRRRRSRRDQRRRDLGQNFLADQRVVERFLAGLDIQPGELVVDLGAGAGALTFPLAETGAAVWAIETDRALVDGLRRSARARPGDIHVIGTDLRCCGFRPSPSVSWPTHRSG